VSETCLFCRIAKGEIPAKFAYQDEEFVALHDTDPKAPTHMLVVPRRHIRSVSALEESDAGLAGRMLLIGKRVAAEAGIDGSGYRLVLNTGANAGQSVDHIHLHVLGGRHMVWPPG
jgi:histidine triad (HIT) family protein